MTSSVVVPIPIKPLHSVHISHRDTLPLKLQVKSEECQTNIYALPSYTLNIRAYESMMLRVAVIGGGPSGLVTLKYLLTAHEYHNGLAIPIEARLFEAEDSIAGTFRYRVYEDAEVPFFSSPLLFSCLRRGANIYMYIYTQTYITLRYSLRPISHIFLHIACLLEISDGLLGFPISKI